jgi:hypothetical protein
MISDRKHWTWQEWLDTPELVRQICLLYMESEADAQAERNRG